MGGRSEGGWLRATECPGDRIWRDGGEAKRGRALRVDPCGGVWDGRSARRRCWIWPEGVERERGHRRGTDDGKADRWTGFGWRRRNMPGSGSNGARRGLNQTGGKAWRRKRRDGSGDGWWRIGGAPWCGSGCSARCLGSRTRPEEASEEWRCTEGRGRADRVAWALLDRMAVASAGRRSEEAPGEGGIEGSEDLAVGSRAGDALMEGFVRTEEEKG